MKRVTEFPLRGRPAYASNLFVHSVDDGRPCFYLSEECDHIYGLDGASVGYIDDNNVYALDGTPVFYITDGYLCDSAGATHCFIGEEEGQGAEDAWQKFSEESERSRANRGSSHAAQKDERRIRRDEEDQEREDEDQGRKQKGDDRGQSAEAQSRGQSGDRSGGRPCR